MNRIYTKMMLLVSLFSLLIIPNIALAAPTATEGIEFRIAYDNGTYAVFMRPNINPNGPAITLTSQVTLKVPYGTDADRFMVTDLVNGVDGTEWAVTSRVDAPVEDTTADYVSLTVSFPTGNHQAFNWASGEEIQVFSFTNQGSCLGDVALLSNSDAFVPDLEQNVRNSVNTNPGNQIDVLNLGQGNLYAGIYGTPASCGDRNTIFTYDLFLPLINR